MNETTVNSAPAKHRQPCVVAVGGGKGGVGKSVIAANLALSLANRGHRCTLVDLDLGGANQHTLLGISNPKRSLTDLFQRKVATLPELSVATPYVNLNLISGTKALIEMANPKHAQKLKVLRQLFQLDVDYVFLDLGAGSHFNVLDFFIAAHEPLLVVAPTPLALENAYHFLKAIYFRQIKKTVRRFSYGERLESELRSRIANGMRSPIQLLDTLGELDPEAFHLVTEELLRTTPRLILNQLHEQREQEVGHQMCAACRRYFNLELTFLGAIHNDEFVYRSVQKRQPAYQLYPDSSFSQSINAITDRLLNQRKTLHA